jgi:hypothetical protein
MTASISRRPIPAFCAARSTVIGPTPEIAEEIAAAEMAILFGHV